MEEISAHRIASCCSYIILHICLAGQLAAQPLPGGVAGASAWLKTHTAGDSHLMEEQISRKTFYTQPKGYLFNGHAAIRLSGNDSLPALPLVSPESFTFAAVYSRSDTLEQALFSLLDGSESPLLVTASRVADLKQRDYLNYPASKQHGIYLYSRRIHNDSPDVQKLMLGIARKPEEALPVSGFQGMIPEAVLYNRILTLSERQRVQSCLALKYGVSLEQNIFPNSYYNAAGEVIWDANRLSSYPFHITGIGRDDLSGLIQRQSTNMDAPALPLIALREGENLSANSFLLWGDNGQSLRMQRQQGMPAMLQRNWVTQTTGQMAEAATTLTISTLLFEEMPEAGKSFWLVTDRSATGRFPAGQTEWRKCDARIQNAIVFNDIYWDTPNAVFTIVQAPGFFVRSDITQSYCRSGSDGSITVECVGGTPPYHLLLEKDGRTAEQATADAAVYTFDALEAARYTLLAFDGNGQTFRDTLFLSHLDAPEVLLAREHKLKDGIAEMDATISADSYTCRWEKSGTYLGSGASLQAQTPGEYTLTVCNAEGCTRTVQTTVKAEQITHFRELTLYPNPVANGVFYLRIGLEQPSPVSVRIYDIQGKLLNHQEIGRSVSFHVFEGHETKVGVYLISVQAGDEVRSLKLIVN